MITLPKGTKDVLPEESFKWHYLENKIRNICDRFGVKEIRTPTFEHTELFLRGVGETTDIVNKEMYTFDDKGGRSMTLKPEGTAGVARCFAENGLDNAPQPTKMYYLTSVFRYEKPQSGRLREHHQFGVELYGSASPYADAEVISIARRFLNEVGVDKLTLHLNSIGCSECRKEYSKALVAYFRSYEDQLCPTCKERLNKNPLRLLDCKVEECKKIAENAPVVSDYLCDNCKEHQKKLCGALDALGIEYVLDPKIVRGLDYYTGTVFEFVSDAIGAQGTVCGGGRYNNLCEEIGGKNVPAVGFGMGLERLIMVMENCGVSFGNAPKRDLYIAPLGAEQYPVAMKAVDELRRNGINADTDISERSLKAQMKYADKCGYKYVVVLGEEEVKKGVVTVKNMRTKEQKECSLEDLSTIIDD